MSPLITLKILGSDPVSVQIRLLAPYKNSPARRRVFAFILPATRGKQATPRCIPFPPSAFFRNPTFGASGVSRLVAGCAHRIPKVSLHGLCEVNTKNQFSSEKGRRFHGSPFWEVRRKNFRTLCNSQADLSSGSSAAYSAQFFLRISRFSRISLGSLSPKLSS